MHSIYEMMLKLYNIIGGGGGGTIFGIASREQ